MPLLRYCMHTYFNFFSITHAFLLIFFGVLSQNALNICFTITVRVCILVLAICIPQYFFRTNSSIKLIMCQYRTILVHGSKISTQRSVSTLFLTHLYFLSWLMSTQNIFTCSKIIVSYFKVFETTKFVSVLVQSSQFRISKFGRNYKSFITVLVLSLYIQISKFWDYKAYQDASTKFIVLDFNVCGAVKFIIVVV